MPNPFAVLDEEAPVALSANQKASSTAESKPKAAAVAANGQNPAANGNQQRSKQQPRGDSVKRAPRPQPGAAVERSDAVDAKSSNHPVHHGPRRGQRGFRGRGRMFDRHSGARPDSERKVAKAWGEPGTEVVNVTEGEDGTIEKPTEETAVGEELASPVEEEPVKTLEEYLAEKASISKTKELPPPRKANEGEENSKWKNAVVLVREEEQDLFAAKPKSTSSAAKKPKDAKVKQQLEIKQHFTENSAPVSRRGGKQPQRQARGGGRGGRGSVPNINDSSAFPILA